MRYRPDRHDLVDSALGDLLSGFAYDLAPGATYVFTETAVVTADVTNSATWTAWVEAEGAYAEATDTATVTVYEPYTYIYLPIMLKDWSTDR